MTQKIPSNTLDYVIQPKPLSSQLKYNNVLINHSKDIINSLGGLDAIIKCCLTNPKRDDYIDSFRFESVLTPLLRENNVLSPSGDHDVQVYANSSKQLQSVNEQLSSIPSVSVDIDINTTQTTNATDIQNASHDQIFVDNLRSYYKKSIILSVNESNNIIFKQCT